MRSLRINLYRGGPGYLGAVAQAMILGACLPSPACVGGSVLQAQGTGHERSPGFWFLLFLLNPLAKMLLASCSWTWLGLKLTPPCSSPARAGRHIKRLDQALNAFSLTDGSALPAVPGRDFGAVAAVQASHSAVMRGSGPAIFSPHKLRAVGHTFAAFKDDQSSVRVELKPR